MTEIYAKAQRGHGIMPLTARDVDLWSVEARRLRDADLDMRPRDNVIVEHGTLRRAFTRMVMDLNATGMLTEDALRNLVERFWKVAVITVEENSQLNRLARSKAYDTPDERWAAAGIGF
jgi:hypothetical protein